MEQHRRRTLALGLASTGFATAAITMVRVWSYLDSTEAPSFAPMWPFPLYLIEVVALAAIVLLEVVVPHHRGASFVAWLALGALSAMALLGAMSIGLNIALALLFLIPASILGDEGQSRVSHNVAGFVFGAVFQGGVMFTIIQYVLRRPMSGPHAG